MRPDPRIGQTRSLVLTAARELFIEGGVRAVTVDAVVTRSGVAKSTVYRHWENRDDLLADLFSSLAWKLDVPPTDLDPVERIAAVVVQLARELRDPARRQMLPAVFDSATRSNELQDALTRIRGAQSKVLSGVIRDAVDAGVLPPATDVREVLLQILGPLTVVAMASPELLTDDLAGRLARLAVRSQQP